MLPYDVRFARAEPSLASIEHSTNMLPQIENICHRNI